MRSLSPARSRSPCPGRLLCGLLAGLLLDAPLLVARDDLGPLSAAPAYLVESGAPAFTIISTATIGSEG